MALPSRKQQIEAVAKYLDSDFMEGKSLDEIATAIVDGYHDALESGLKKPATNIRLGMLVKTPLSNKVMRVSWMDGERLWVVGEADRYGWIGKIDQPYWTTCEEFRPKRRIDGKLIEMTDDDIAEAWANPEFKVGDKLSQHQRQYRFEVIATSPSSALLRNVETGFIVADGTANLNNYYKRETEVSEIVW